MAARLIPGRAANVLTELDWYAANRFNGCTDKGVRDALFFAVSRPARATDRN